MRPPRLPGATSPGDRLPTTPLPITAASQPPRTSRRVFPVPGQGSASTSRRSSTDRKIDVLASGPTQAGNGSTTPTFNSQVPLPYPAANGTTRDLILQPMPGAGSVAQTQFFNSAAADVHGTVLMPTVPAPSGGQTSPYGFQSVFGGPSSGAGFTGPVANGYANVTPPVIETGVAICCGYGYWRGPGGISGSWPMRSSSTLPRTRWPAGRGPRRWYPRSRRSAAARLPAACICRCTATTLISM